MWGGKWVKFTLARELGFGDYTGYFILLIEIQMAMGTQQSRTLEVLV